MNFDRAIEVIADQLSSHEPQNFGPGWIIQHCPSAYRFLIKKERTEIGDVDWDRITLALPRRYQSKWRHSGDTMRRRNPPNPYRNKTEVDRLLAPYRSKLYTFYVIQDKDDYVICDFIAIRLVRLAQKGNVTAKEHLLSLITGVIEEWYEKNAFFGRWRFYSDLLQRTTVGCIFRYRYSGSFLRYLLRSLEYGSYRLRSIEAFSLDEITPGTERRMVDCIIQDPETREIRIFKTSVHKSYPNAD